MFSKKKGQSALEYLMTYGWALVVIVIVIAALVFLIQPSQVGGNTCSTTSGILITNHQVDSAGAGGVNKVVLALSNQTASTLTDLNISVTGSVGSAPVNYTDQAPLRTLGTIAENETVLLAEDITAATYSLQITMKYTDRDQFPRTVTSTCNGTAS
ncbi:MAG: hypothetical protein Q7K34_00265 [archaeon]|nr:hypothetical protein [archaeon]